MLAITLPPDHLERARAALEFEREARRHSYHLIARTKGQAHPDAVRAFGELQTWSQIVDAFTGGDANESRHFGEIPLRERPQ